VYVDDYLVIAETHTDLVAAFRVMDEEALLLGLTFNAKKDIGTVEPLDEIEFLGVDIRTRIGDLSLPVDKRQKYLTSIFQFGGKYLYERVAPKSELEPLVGKLGFAARTCGWGYLYLQNCFDALYGGMEDRDLCPLSPEFWDDIMFYIRVLQLPPTPAGGITRNTLHSVVLTAQELAEFKKTKFIQMQVPHTAWEQCITMKLFHTLGTLFQGQITFVGVSCGRSE
jgi:hypothetical protein